ncbi:SEC-C metal-binding domain-containing protein [Microbispora sp. NPDC049633]|uniref:SEC-C metal-binding domain-containing protein n=1 Tax=Microbispora sp. NPDC049633 TaxID=3154355 RepID=UPI00342FA79E
MAATRRPRGSRAEPMPEPVPNSLVQYGDRDRNAACPSGSPRKFKHCHGADSDS